MHNLTLDATVNEAVTIKYSSENAAVGGIFDSDQIAPEVLHNSSPTGFFLSFWKY